MNLYESFAQATQLGDLHTCLMMDMKACQEDDVRLLCHLTPSIYTEVSTSICVPGTAQQCQWAHGRPRHLVAHNPHPPLPSAAGLSRPLLPHHSCPLLLPHSIKLKNV